MFFSVKRVGPKGPDSNQHLFCIQAHGNQELVRTGESHESCLLNGAGGSSAAATRTAIDHLCIKLNEVIQSYLNGEFHPVSQTFCVTFMRRWDNGHSEPGHKTLLATSVEDAKQQFEVCLETPVTDFGCDSVTGIRYWKQG